MPHSIRPGDLLADRYLLVDLLTESGNGRFWRAHDRILDRHVAVHVVDAEDAHAEAMMAAARSSAAVHDRRILRVLDVDRRDDLCYVVNEWGSGSSLDILVSGEGPMGARRAAWVVSEVAQSIAVAHEAGVAHGRLVPENVLIDETGSVRVIGFSVDAALLGLPPGRLSSDVTDLGALLYYLLTGKWAGVSRSAVPAAPQEGGRVLRPRQVKAGVPRALDSLCDEVINGSGGNVGARGLSEALAEFVGDTAGMAAAEASNGTRQMPRLSPPPPVAPEIAGEPEPGGDPGTPAGQTPTGQAASSADLPTQAGMPIFDDESDEVSWLRARAEKPAPPPPFEEPPERPLFAPAPAEGEPQRRARAVPPPTQGRDYWPWEATGASSTGSGVLPAALDDEDDKDDVPGRSWMRLAMLVGLCVLLLVAVVMAFNLGRGRSPLGELPGEEESSSEPTTAPTGQPITVAAVADFDPQGDPPEENPELAPLVVDGDPATAWRTMTYEQNLGPGGLKTGVGLLVDLGESQEVSQVDLTTVGAPTGVSIYVTARPPVGVRTLTPAVSGEAKPRQRLTLDEPASGRYVVVWLTSLPEIPGGFRGEVAEVVVRG